MCSEHCRTGGVISLFFLELVAETLRRSSSAVIRPARRETITKYFAQSHAKYHQKMLPQLSSVWSHSKSPGEEPHLPQGYGAFRSFVKIRLFTSLPRFWRVHHPGLSILESPTACPGQVLSPVTSGCRAERWCVFLLDSEGCTLSREYLTVESLVALLEVYTWPV